MFKMLWAPGNEPNSYYFTVSFSKTDHKVFGKPFNLNSHAKWRLLLGRHELVWTRVTSRSAVTYGGLHVPCQPSALSHGHLDKIYFKLQTEAMWWLLINNRFSKMESVGILGPVFVRRAKRGDSQMPQTSSCNDTDAPVINYCNFWKCLLTPPSLI